MVPDKGWNSGYIHGLLYGARRGVELWLYSWTLKSMVLDKGWKSGYIHGLLYGARQGVEIWLYSWTLVWC